jgi:prepilin-type N-terminal cleavage/methylation domain-containing protein
LAIGNRQSGFTLIEILLAIGILSLGITAVLFMFTVGVQSHRRARDRTQAAMLADTVINQVSADLVGQTLPDYYGTDVDGNPQLVDARHADFPGLTYSVDFFPIYDSDLEIHDFYRVTVTVRWGKPPGNPGTELDPRNSEQFVTIVRRRNF